MEWENLLVLSVIHCMYQVSKRRERLRVGTAVEGSSQSPVTCSHPGLCGVRLYSCVREIPFKGNYTLQKDVIRDRSEQQLKVTTR